MSAEHNVAAQYRQGNLEAAYLTALAAMGKDPERLAHDDLMGADEFHIGGAQATRELAEQLGLTADMHLLDLGSGTGGPARHLAAAYGCRVTGIDLTDEFVAVAESLTRRMRMQEQVAFRQGSATLLPFADGMFDRATLLHVGMNIADKRALCAEAHRVLRPGGLFAIYDVMRVGEGEITYPVPWAGSPAWSFVETPAAYRAALEATGFTMVAERARADFALTFFAMMRDRVAQSGPPPIGPQVVMGADAPQKLANVLSAVESGVVAPVEIIARR